MIAFIIDHKTLLEPGSTPVEDSSKKRILGALKKAIAIQSFLLFPPDRNCDYKFSYILIFIPLRMYSTTYFVVSAERPFIAAKNSKCSFTVISPQSKSS